MLRRRRPGKGPYPKARLALVVAATIGAVACPTPAQFTFGTHYAALYNAEALKSEVFQSVRTPPAVPVVSEFVQSGPQAADLTPPSFVIESAASPATGAIFELVQNPVEPVDQGTTYVLESLTSPEPVAPSAVGELVYSPAQPDLIQYSKVFPSVVAGATPRLPEFVYFPPQQDLTQYAWVFKAATVSAPVGEFVYAPPQLTNFVLQAQLSKPLVGFPPGIGAFVDSPPQADLTQSSKVFKSVAAPVPSSLLGRFLVTAPQAADLTLQVWLAKPLVGSLPTLGTFVSVPPQPDLSQRSSLFPYAAPGVIVGPTVKPFVASQEQRDLTQQSWLTKPLSGFPPGIGKFVSAPQAQLDLTQQSWLIKPAAPPLPGVVPALVQNPREDAVQQTAYVLESLASPEPVIPQAIIRQFVSNQAQLDLTLPASILPSAAQPPTAPVLVPSIWAAPQYDLTTRSWVQTSAAVPPPSIFVIRGFVSNQFPFDPTLPAIFFPSTMEGIVVPPEPPLEAGAIPAGGKATYVKRKRSRIEELRELLARVGAPEPIVGFPAATEAPAVVVPTRSPKLTLEAQQRDLRRTAQRVQDLKSAQNKIAQLQKKLDDDDDEDAAFLLL